MEGIVGLITARGGSKGIVGKNIRPIGGIPLIAWTIRAALESQRLDRVLVSTDDAEIARVSRQFGADVPFYRPDELAQDDSPHVDSLIHALRWLESDEGSMPEYCVLLQPTCPLRIASDIDGAVDLAVTRRADAVLGVCEASDHPYLARMINEDGSIKEFVDVDIEYYARQFFPKAYRVNGAVYVNRSEALIQSKQMFPEGTLAYVMPASRSWDIDTPWEFHVVDLLLRDQNAGQAA